MDRFDVAVAEQLKTMDRLLLLQGEIERNEKVIEQLEQLKEEREKIKKLKEDIAKMKEELAEIQSIFEMQTEEAIKSFHLQESI
ncbi:YgaB family protein [Sutcliffiella horikoshii]|uniref:YgaB family protein n=1 Tax=Sutcliffiella horikoshii TaxID=79883 RepID=UPI001CFF1246|nr:YgaB family protein [Sutcliffiella horikoshii]